MKQGEASSAFAFFTVGVEGANHEVLARISTRPPAKLRGLNFRDLFLWLSKSMRAVSESTPGDKVCSSRPAGPRSDRGTPCGSWSTAANRGRPTSNPVDLARTIAEPGSSARPCSPRVPTGPGCRAFATRLAGRGRWLPGAGGRIGARQGTAPGRGEIDSWVARAGERVFGEASALGVPARELAGTFLGAIVGDDWAAFVQVGDGVIVFDGEAGYDFAFWPDNGEYANATRFLTDDDYRDHLHIKIMDRHVRDSPS